MYSGKGTDSDVSTPSTENTFIKQRLSPCYMSSPPKVNSSLFQNTLFESPNFELAEQQNAFYRRKECINYPTNNYYMSCNQPVHNSDFGIVKEEYLSRQDILSHSSEL
jgi:hypothetical protein